MKDNLEVRFDASVLVCLAACVAVSYVNSAAAQGAAAPLERVIISASRTESTLADTGSTVSVITAEELEQRQIRFVSDALRAVPGVAVNRLGPAGTQTQVRIRGAEANHTVVLIDGVKINDPFTSEVDFAHLLSAQIDRIEILRGPQSVLYGSEAIGGVISIFTKRGTPGMQADVSAEGGSFSTANGSAALRGATQTVNYALAASALTTDGTNVSRFGSEDDGYRNRTLSRVRRLGTSHRRLARRIAALSRQPQHVRSAGLRLPSRADLRIDHRWRSPERRRPTRRNAARSVNDRCAGASARIRAHANRGRHVCRRNFFERF